MVAIIFSPTACALDKIYYFVWPQKDCVPLGSCQILTFLTPDGNLR